MIRNFFTLFLLLCLSTLNGQDLIERTQLGITQQEQKTPSVANGLVSALQEKKAVSYSRSSQNYQLFNIADTQEKLPANITKGVVLNLQKEVFTDLRNKANTLLNLTIPVNESAAFELDLFQVNIYAPGFKVTTSAPVNQEIKHSGIFYNGIVKGDPNSVVAVTIFDDMIDIFIQDSQGNYKLSKNSTDQAYTLYYGANRLKKNKVACNANENNYREATSKNTRSQSRSNAVAEVPVYVEADYDLYVAKNRNLNTTIRFMEMLIAETVALYARLDIPIKMSELKINTQPDGYPRNDSIDDEKLSAFANRLQDDFPGILAHLVSGETGGGIANLGVLCSTYAIDDTNGPFGVSGVGVPDAQTPDLDDINTFAHELGHNFGSYHTQACFWNGNNTAIDGCVSPEPGEGEEVTCSRPSTECPTGGGTIMSYCSTPDDPIEDCVANNNWHPQVAAYIKSKYMEAINEECIEDVNDTAGTGDTGTGDTGTGDTGTGDTGTGDTGTGDTGTGDTGTGDTGTGDTGTGDTGTGDMGTGDTGTGDTGTGDTGTGDTGTGDTGTGDTGTGDTDTGDTGTGDTGTGDTGTGGPDIGTCATITGTLTTSSIGNNNAYVYTPQPNGAIDNHFRYRPVGTTIWKITNISTSYYRYLSGLLAGTTYEFQVSQICADGSFSDFSASSFFTTTGEAQGGGTDTNVEDGNTGTENPSTGTCAPITSTLTTSSIGDNNAYIYTPQPKGAINNQFRYRAIGSSTWLTTDISTSYYRYLSNLVAGTNYEFQVSQICEDGSYSDFSASSFFTTTGEAPGGDNGNTDTNTGNESEETICIPVTSSQLYVSSVSASAAYVYTPQLYGAMNSQFRYRIVGTTSWELSDMSTLYYRYLTGLSAGSTYEYQVRLECAPNAWSIYSDSYEFTTASNLLPTGSETQLDYATFRQLSISNTTVNLSVSPNPVLSELVLNLDQAAASWALVKIYSISGQLIKELPIEQGASKTAIDVSRLQTGLYLLEYRTANFGKTTKFVKN